MQQIGAIFIFTAIFLFFTGMVLIISPKTLFLGKLPGDILIKKDNFTFFFPITTSILISLILSLLFFLFKKD